MRPQAEMTDDFFALGRAVRSDGENYYIIPGCAVLGASSGSQVQNFDVYEPWYVASPVLIDQLAFEVTSFLTDQNMRVGLYRADRDWQPVGPPLCDSGDISVATNGVKTYTTGLLLEPGRYLAVWNATATVGLRTFFAVRPVEIYGTTLGTAVAIGRMRGTRNYAAFPTTPTPWSTTSSYTPAQVVHVVVARVKNP